jgi:phage terminase small subunit
MSGVKGKSGGARQGTGGARPGTGGARPGAGRKPKPKPVLAVSSEPDSDPKKFLQSVMNDELADPRIRMDAAKALLPFMHQKLGEGGKKDERLNAAKKIATGKFSPVAPPLRLVK